MKYSVDVRYNSTGLLAWNIYFYSNIEDAIKRKDEVTQEFDRNGYYRTYYVDVGVCRE